MLKPLYRKEKENKILELCENTNLKNPFAVYLSISQGKGYEPTRYVNFYPTLEIAQQIFENSQLIERWTEPEKHGLHRVSEDELARIGIKIPKIEQKIDTGYILFGSNKRQEQRW